MQRKTGDKTMIRPNHMPVRPALAVAIAAILISACASVPKHPEGYEQVHAKLTALQSDPNLANGAPVASRKLSWPYVKPSTWRRIACSRRIASTWPITRWDTARALAETHFAEQERTALNEQSEKARLNARTLEADRAKSDADHAKSDALVARAESAEQKLAANSARSDADAALLAANSSQQHGGPSCKRQLEILQARPTDRGLVLTLGDTLFATGKAELKSGATANLDRLTTFMNEYPDRRAPSKASPIAWVTRT
jgi:hypothetical protein